MSGDQLLRAYSILSSLKSNIPEHYEIEERWVDEYHGALVKITSSGGIDLEEFRIPTDCLVRSVSSSNYLTGEVRYRTGRFCNRSLLMQKLDAVMTYFQGLQGGQDNSIGFKV